MEGGQKVKHPTGTTQHTGVGGVRYENTRRCHQSGTGVIITVTAIDVLSLMNKSEGVVQFQKLGTQIVKFNRQKLLL